MGPSPLRSVPWLLCLAVVAGCRKGSENLSGSFIPVAPASDGTQGCGPSAPVPGMLTPVYSGAAIGPLSAIAAAAEAELLFLTGADGSIHVLDFSGGLPPTDSVLVAPGVIEAELLVPAGIAGVAEPCGIAVFDQQFLIVAERRSNSLLAVRRDVPDTVVPVAGRALESGGFSDGQGGGIRFHFTAVPPLLVAADGTVFVGDTENHALRAVTLGGIPDSVTITGTGAPGDGTGTLPMTEMDTPAGLVASCAGEVVVIESGKGGVAGNRLLDLAVGGASFFGGFDGSSMVLAGDGTNATTEGIGDDAQLGTPMGLVSTQDGLYFWVDAKEGILRRFDLATGLCDCPLFATCADAVLAGGSFDGDAFALALGASGSIYVLETATQTLHRVDP